MIEDAIPNKVANSGLITISLADYYPEGDRIGLDLVDALYEGIMLREKDFRAFIKDHNWGQYQSAFVWVHCSADAIIPQWAYMLIGASLEGIAADYCFGSQEQLESLLIEKELNAADFSQFLDQRLILKGCSDLPIPPHSFMSITKRLKPLVKSLMYGEACSSVPVYKRKA